MTSTPARAFSNSQFMWLKAPMPEDATVIVPGFAFASAMTSLSVLKRELRATTATPGPSLTTEMFWMFLSAS
jgi:hypothetical protein